MKKVFAAVTAVALALSLTACGDDDGDEPFVPEGFETMEPGNDDETPVTNSDGVETFEPVTP